MKADICSSLVDSVITLTFFSNNVKDDAQKYLVLIVNNEKSKCHLKRKSLFPQTMSIGI